MDQRVKDLSHYEIVDLYKLCQSLWQQKWLILFITFTTTLIGIIYLAFAKPIYEVSVRVSPPDAIEIDTLNYARLVPGTLLKPFDVKTIYDIFSRILLAESTKYDFLHAQRKLNQNQHSPHPQLSITIKEVPKTIPSQYILTARGNSANQISSGLRNYIDFVSQQSKLQIIHIMEQQQQNILQGLQQEIDMTKEQVKKNKLYQLAQLKEALKIAEAAGLTGKAPLMHDTNIKKSNVMYLRGTRALHAEIENLTQRDDELFSPKLRGLQSKYNLYKKAPINLEHFHLFYRDGTLKSPESPVIPKTSLILTLSIGLGLISSMFIIIIRNFFRANVKL